MAFFEAWFCGASAVALVAALLEAPARWTWFGAGL
jgi:hypothetical protein